MPFLFYTISRIRKNASGKSVFAKKILTFCFPASKNEKARFHPWKHEAPMSGKEE